MPSKSYNQIIPVSIKLNEIIIICHWVTLALHANGNHHVKNKTHAHTKVVCKKAIFAKMNVLKFLTCGQIGKVYK